MPNCSITIGGVNITVQALDYASYTVVKAALSSMKFEQTNTLQGSVLRLQFSDGAWQLEDRASDIKHRLKLAGDVIYYLTDRIAFHVADKTQHVHALHAAAVGKGANAFVIPAISGAGKSTFTAWLTANGFEYITDELVLLARDGSLSGLSRPIQIKPNGLSAIDHLLKNPSQVINGDCANSVPLDCLAHGLNSNLSRTEKTVRAFIFPNFSASPSLKLNDSDDDQIDRDGSRVNVGFSFQALSIAQSGMRLMASHVNARNLHGHGFRELMSLVRNTPSYSLDYAGFASLPDDFLTFLDSLLLKEQ